MAYTEPSEKLLKKQLAALKADKAIIPTNKKLLLDFLEAYSRAKSTASTRIIYCSTIVRFFHTCPKPVTTLTAADVRTYFQNLSPKNASRGRKAETYAPQTLTLNRMILRRFFKFTNNGELPDFAKKSEFKINTRAVREARKFDPDKIPTVGEVERVIKAAHDIEMKAFIASLFDTGCRRAEWLGLRVDDIIRTKQYWCANVEGKTGKRKVYLTRSSALVKQWLELHPLIGHEKNPFVWVQTYGPKPVNKPLSNTTLHRVFKRVFERAGVSLTKARPHALRHCRATEVARQGFPAQAMNLMFGWDKDSNMHLFYSHMTQSDVKTAIDKASGYKQPEHETEKPYLVCPQCKKQSPRTTKLCDCGWAFDAGFLIQEEANSEMDVLRAGATNSLLVEFMQDKEKLFAQLCKMQKEISELKKNGKNGGDS